MMRFSFLYVLLAAVMVSCTRNSDPTPTPPVVAKKGDFTFNSLSVVQKSVPFNTTAIGRESKLGLEDGPKISLTDNGIAHPSVIYIPEGVNGYKYWCAMTPHFGIIAKQDDNEAYENPHILCSKDGINWVEPNGISNPVDKAIRGPYNNYWSDTNLVYYKGTFYLYYRGCGFPRNYFGDKNMYLRAVVVKTSKDGVTWSPRKLLFASNVITKGIDDQSGIVSQSFLEDNGTWYCYDVAFSTTLNPYSPQGNQTSQFVFRRSDTSPDGNFGEYSADKICQFDSRPWGDANDPWHLEVVKYDNTFFMLICAGLSGKSNGDSLWLAYSKDGKNFKVIPKAIFINDTYKSGILPLSKTDDDLTFMIYQSQKSTGAINAYKLVLNRL